MEMGPTIEGLFERRLTYPDIDLKERFDALVGLDAHKERLTKVLGLLVNPGALDIWAKRYHAGASSALKYVKRRPPLIVLAGDVGSGKTELAETIGDAVARQERINITLFPMSLSTRGQGRVGEMTLLLSAAFSVTLEEAKKLRSERGKARGAVILLVDEADALAQSREAAAMHHEDRAGVNAFIRGIDTLGNGSLPVAVIMCTNRLNALDPAIRRRSADLLRFERPNEFERKQVLDLPLQELGLSGEQIQQVVHSTGAQNGRGYGFTFSDLTQRYLPAVILAAYPDRKVDPESALKVAREMLPTPPFEDLDK